MEELPELLYEYVYTIDVLACLARLSAKGP
jgi:hypothetical protein